MTTFFSACNPGNKKSDQEHVRLLPMEGGFNFRDMGGYRTISGKQVKWGKVFRSDELHNLTDNDLEYLNEIPLRTIVDFRSEQELKDAPDKKPASVINSYALTITPGNRSNINDPEGLKDVVTESGERFMKGINYSFVTDSSIIARYRKFFAILQDENQTPLLFHCTAGKDRTGMGAALFLASLGVDEETIYKDYMLSNKYIEKKYKAILDTLPSMKALLEVRPQYLQTGLEQIQKDHGSIENYLRDVLQVDLDYMRKLYLE
jgi:protein-tyrosine phosphatase